MAPDRSSWGNRFARIDDRGRVKFLKFVLINQLNQYMKQFNQDFKVTLVIVYKKYHANGINSWFYTEEEFRHEIDSFWTMKDELRCFRKCWLLPLDKIVAIRHEFEYINKSRNHHNKRKEIVVDDDIFDF